MSPLSLIPLFFLLALVGPAVWALARVYRRARTPRSVVCPDACQQAIIRLDGRYAVQMHALGEARSRVRQCSLWPGRASCARVCLK